VLTRSQYLLVGTLAGLPVLACTLLLIVNRPYMLQLFTDVSGWPIAALFAVSVALNALLLLHGFTSPSPAKPSFMQQLGRVGRHAFSVILTLVALWSVLYGPVTVAKLLRVLPVFMLPLKRVFVAALATTDVILFIGVLFLTAKLTAARARIAQTGEER